MDIKVKFINPTIITIMSIKNTSDKAKTQYVVFNFTHHNKLVI